MIDRDRITEADKDLWREAKAIVKKEGKPPVYLVWVLHNSGLTSVRAICTDRTLANYYRRLASLDDRVIRAYVEQSITNHYYGVGFMAK